jgi:indolepyruvate ferredoxin oxidoreductase
VEDKHEAMLSSIPEPTAATIDECFDLLVTGVGGTGVVTVGQLITMAAHLEGKGASVLDFTGFAQKFGTVLSYIRIAENPSDINQVRIEKARADAVIGCDLVVSSSPRASATYARGETRAIINTAEMQTGDFVRHRDASLRANDRVVAISNVVGAHNFDALDANAMAEKLMGNTIYANVLLLGSAWQKGMVPVSLASLMRAIELNGVEIEKNKIAFSWGRLAIESPEYLETIVQDGGGANDAETLQDVVDRRAAFLVDYQNQSLADRYCALVDRVRNAEQAFGSEQLSDAVARSYFKLLSYKDEYEVARLHTQTGFLETVKRNFGDNAKIRFHLAPPLLSSQKDARGRPRKKEFGGWMVPAFRLLASLRGLRGTKLDLFGYTEERQMERALIGEFEATVEKLLDVLTAENLDDALKVVQLYMDIRGYGPVKEQAVKDVRARIDACAIMHA